MRGGTYRQGRTVVRRTGKDGGNDVCGHILLAIFACIFLVAVPLLNISNENALLNSKIISRKVADNAVDVRHAKKINDIVHIQGASYDSTIHDQPFNLNINHAVNLERQTEYCQWKEISSTKRSCRGSGEDEKCVDVTTYHYIKSWSPFLVNSFLFDQPAAHHNPSRNPYPSSIIPSEDLIANENNQPPLCEIDSSVLQNAKIAYRGLDFTLGAKPPPPSFFTKLWYRFISMFTTSVNSDDNYYNIRYEDISALQGTQYSHAATKHGFYYVGQGGYFFSPFQESTTAKLAKAFFGYLEGSLFDWQFGDLMPSCTPGDIRVKYYVQDPDQLSVLGILQTNVENEHETSTVKIGSHFISSVMTDGQHPVDINLKIGYAHEGSVSSEHMMDAIVYESWLYVLFSRLLLIPWAYVTIRLFGAFLGYELRSGSGVPYPTSFTTIALAVLGTWAFIVGFCEFMVNQQSTSFMEYDEKTQHSTLLNRRLMILFMTSVVSFILVDRSVARTPSSGFNAVWKLFGRKDDK